MANLLTFFLSGAKVDMQRWTDGWTALHMAAMMGLEEVALMLLQAGASTHLEDEEGMRPSQVARQWRHTSVADIIER